MKTIETLATPNANPNRARVRSILALLGILIAIFCLLALQQDVHSADGMNVGVAPLIQTSKIIGTNLLMEAKTWL